MGQQSYRCVAEQATTHSVELAEREAAISSLSTEVDARCEQIDLLRAEGLLDD